MSSSLSSKRSSDAPSGQASKKLKINEVEPVEAVKAQKDAKQKQSIDVMPKKEKQQTVVVNVAKKYGEKDYVYIGRHCHYTGHKQSIWHNPFRIDKNDNQGRQKALERYEDHVRNNASLLVKLSELKGKRLGCWCKPLPCHGDVLVKLIHEFVP